MSGIVTVNCCYVDTLQYVTMLQDGYLTAVDRYVDLSSFSLKAKM